MKPSGSLQLFRFLETIWTINTIRTNIGVLGDPGGSQSGWEKRRDESFQVPVDSPNYFQKFKQMPAPDWVQKMLCSIVPNRRTVSSKNTSLSLQQVFTLPSVTSCVTIREFLAELHARREAPRVSGAP